MPSVAVLTMMKINWNKAFYFIFSDASSMKATVSFHFASCAQKHDCRHDSGEIEWLYVTKASFVYEYFELRYKRDESTMRWHMEVEPEVMNVEISTLLSRHLQHPLSNVSDLSFSRLTTANIRQSSIIIINFIFGGKLTCWSFYYCGFTFDRNKLLMSRFNFLRWHSWNFLCLSRIVVFGREFSFRQISNVFEFSSWLNFLLLNCKFFSSTSTAWK